MTSIGVIESFKHDFVIRDTVTPATTKQFLDNLVQACGNNEDEALGHFNEALVARNQRLADAKSEEVPPVDETGPPSEPTLADTDGTPPVEEPTEPPQPTTEPADLTDANKPLAVPPTTPFQDEVVEELLSSAWSSNNPTLDHSEILGRLPGLLRARYPTLTKQAAYSLSSSLIKQYAIEQLKDKKDIEKTIAELLAKSFERIAREQAARGTPNGTSTQGPVIIIGLAVVIWIGLSVIFSLVFHAVYSTRTVVFTTGPSGVTPLQVVSTPHPWMDAIAHGTLLALTLTVLMVAIPYFFGWLFVYIRDTLIRKEVRR